MRFSCLERGTAPPSQPSDASIFASSSQKKKYDAILRAQLSIYLAIYLARLPAAYHFLETFLIELFQLSSTKAFAPSPACLELFLSHYVQQDLNPHPWCSLEPRHQSLHNSAPTKSGSIYQRQQRKWETQFLLSRARCGRTSDPQEKVQKFPINSW